MCLEENKWLKNKKQPDLLPSKQDSGYLEQLEKDQAKVQLKITNSGYPHLSQNEKIFKLQI